MENSCTECLKHSGLSKDFYELKKRVQNNEDEYKPIANRAKDMFESYPETIKILTDKVVELDKQNLLENSKLDTIKESMDNHSKQEEAKRKERKGDRKANRNNTIYILVSLLAISISFGVWLVQAHEATEIRLIKIEQVLGIEN